MIPSISNVAACALLLCASGLAAAEPVEAENASASPQSAPLDGLQIQALEGDQWYGLYFSGAKAGHAVQSLEIDENGGVILTDDARFKVNMAGMSQEMRIFTQRVYGPDGNLQQLNSRINDPQGVKTFVGAVEGEELVFRSDIGGAQQESRLPRPDETLRDALKQVELVQGSPRPGDEVRFSLFEPIYSQEVGGVSRIAGVEERTADGETFKVYKVQTVLDVMPLETISYVREDGVIYEDIVAGMIEMRLESKEEALEEVENHDVVVSNAVLLDDPLENPRQRERLQLRVFGPLNQRHLFNDERQYLQPQGGHFAFTAHLVPLEGFEVAQLPIEDASLLQWTEPTLYVQSDDQRLIDQANQILQGETDTLAASEKLMTWVYENVRSTFSAQLTNALEVLENPAGDCTEHSILFIGLARAAGIPARAVAGLVYVDAPKPGFFFHQWAKVWVGKWLDVDPTFNQLRADVTHIKLAEGDLLEQAQLIPIIGKLDVEVVSEEGAKDPEGATDIAPEAAAYVEANRPATAE